MENPETRLIERLRNKTEQHRAFSEVVQAYQQQLYWHIREMVLDHEHANDILQNTFLKAWNALDTFRGESKISTWLYRIATNETLTFLAQQKARNHFSIDDYEGTMLQKLESDNYFDGNNAERLLQEAILTLPEKQRLVFNMKYFREMKYEEMSEILETSVGALKASYHHAVKKIEQFVISKQ